MNEPEMIRYLGDGSAYVEGIPARDLTRDEWDRLRADLRERALATGLYAVPPTKTEKPARSDKPAARTEA
jgi:hypothetical protein